MTIYFVKFRLFRGRMQDMQLTGLGSSAHHS